MKQVEHTCEFKIEWFWNRFWFRLFGYGLIVSWCPLDPVFKVLKPRRSAVSAGEKP